MDDRTIAIEARGLCRSFGGRIVLRPIDLAIPAGQTVALTGANGAGKTTLLRILSGLNRPTAGKVFWFGQPAATNSPACRELGVVMHESQIYPHLTVHENLLFSARMHGVSEPRRQIHRWLESVGLERQRDCLAAKLSRGMRQRLALARALLHDPRVLLWDEPFSGLDRENAIWLRELLGKLRDAGKTVCFSTHDADFARNCADRALHLHGGRLQEHEMAMAEPIIASVGSSRARAA
ncbi:MAG: heme ABC exporter ATP-binding protein CcmA [Pirellulales bacterium]|nr:heme ABC exporter ATP-binding protein CcmA [Pirellulales bacterium]